MRETDAETMEWKEAKSGARSRSIIRALHTHTHTHFCIISILAFAPGVLFTRVDEARELRSRGLPPVVIATTGQDPG